MNLLITLRSELFKTKRTVALYFTIAAAAFAPMMSMLDLVFDGVGPDHERNIFNELFTTKFMMTGAVVLPWFIILITTLLAQIEYRNNTWKQLLTSPQSKANIFFAKFINIQLLIFLFLFTNHLLMIINAIILHFMYPSLNVLAQPLDWAEIVNTPTRSYLVLLGVCAVQFWLALRFRNFIVPVAIGISAWFIGSILVMQLKASFAEYFPFSFHAYVTFPGYENKDLTNIYWTSICYAVLFLIIGFLNFRRRRMSA